MDGSKEPREDNALPTPKCRRKGMEGFITKRGPVFEDMGMPSQI
jgi:hypothetical protein